MANRDGGLSRFVVPEIVVEIRVGDLVDTNADDLPIERMTLHYDPASGYEPKGDRPIAAMLAPVLIRERTDKVPDVACVGLEQVTSRLPLPSAAAPVAALGGTTVLVRRVFTKGDGAVRKVALLETHKAGEGWPAFVVWSTDYSAGRAEPLKTTIKPASTAQIGTRLVEDWLVENVKKGWVEA
jgi:hypothetical protein